MAYQNPSGVRIVLQDHPELFGGGTISEKPEIVEVRSGLASMATDTLDREQIVQRGAKAVNEMKDAYAKAGMIVMCKTMNEMVKALAEDDGTSIEQAKDKALSNAARGFTAEKTGIIYMRNVTGKDHDIVHELVHATSAPGGTTKVKAEFGDPLNEGLTEYHAIDFCRELKVPLAAAYPLEVAFVRKLEGAVGPAMLFEAYMKNGGMGPILAALSDRWVQRGSAFAGDEATKAFAPPPEASQRVTALAERLKGRAFLEPELQPFWNTLLS